MSDIGRVGPAIGIRELSRQTRKAVEQLQATGEPIIITKQGQPVAALVAVDQARLKDLVLSAAPEFLDSTREADEAFASGRTRSMSAVLADMANEDARSDTALADSPELESAELVAKYGDLVKHVSAESEQLALYPSDAREIRATQAASVGLFRELVGWLLQTLAERTRASEENSAAVANRDLEDRVGFDFFAWNPDFFAGEAGNLTTLPHLEPTGPDLDAVPNHGVLMLAKAGTGHSGPALTKVLAHQEVEWRESLRGAFKYYGFGPNDSALESYIQDFTRLIKVPQEIRTEPSLHHVVTRFSHREHSATQQPEGGDTNVSSEDPISFVIGLKP